MNGHAFPVMSGGLETTVAPGSMAGLAITRAIIVDENPEIRSRLTARLEARGLMVESADNSGDALAMLRSFSPDVAFLDVTLPHLGGIEVLREIRDGNLDMGVVLTAPLSPEQLALNASQHGVDDNLGKSFDAIDFEAALDRTSSRLMLARQSAALRRHLGIDRAPSGVVAQTPGRPDPHVQGFELAARCVPAGQGEVGGDFYDWQKLSPTVLSLVVGDVMGKGMVAALMMGTVRAVLRALVPQNAPADALQRAAAALEPDLVRSGSFVTLFHAQLNTASACLSYSDAGHGFVLFRRADGTLEELRRVGLPLGVLNDEVYRQDTITLERGDVLVVYSDGLTQAQPALLLDRSALASLIDNTTSANDIAERLIGLAQLAGPLTDDLTIAVLRRCA